MPFPAVVNDGLQRQSTGRRSSQGSKVEAGVCVDRREAGDGRTMSRVTAVRAQRMILDPGSGKASLHSFLEGSSTLAGYGTANPALLGDAVCRLHAFSPSGRWCRTRCADFRRARRGRYARGAEATSGESDVVRYRAEQSLISPRYRTRAGKTQAARTYCR